MVLNQEVLFRFNMLSRLASPETSGSKLQEQPEHYSFSSLASPEASGSKLREVKEERALT